MEQHQPDLLTLEQAAARLGLLTCTLRRAVARGYLSPVYRTDGGAWFSREAIDRSGVLLARPGHTALT